MKKFHLFVTILIISPLLPELSAEEQLVSFENHALSDEYFSEGASAGDINGDGSVDLVYGPHWYAGPEFKTKHEIYPPKPQPRERYADNFFTWVHDVDGNGWNDILIVGLPGTPAFVFENPGVDKLDQHWRKHQVFDSVGNESPHFRTLVKNDSKHPQLVCTRKGVYGFITINEKTPFENWAFHPVSPRIGVSHFGHGLGIGDVNGDGLQDVIYKAGWYEQPKSDAENGKPWIHHPEKFSNSYGGAEMFAYDVDGDGDNDIITSLAAHDFGLAWYEQVKEKSEITFREHIIMGSQADQNRYGVVFSELHSLQLVDVDGDGLKDIVTGKTYYSHHQKSPMWNAGAVAYWFRLVRTKEGVDWIPYPVAADTGIGRQIGIFDVNQDNLPDIVVGGMKGAHALIQKRETVDKKHWLEAQPKIHKGNSGRTDRGKPEKFEKDGRVANAIEGESMKILRASAGKAGTQKMSNFKTDQWSSGSQLFWSNATPRARLDLEFSVEKSGAYEIEGSFTIARDYAIINVLINNKACGNSLDLFHYPEVKTTGTLSLGKHNLKAGKHKLTLETTGINESAVKKHMVGLDYIRLVPK